MPGEFPLLDGFAQSELTAIQSANLPHLASVETVDGDDVWSEVATAQPCRLMHVSSFVRLAADQRLRPDTSWLVAFAASSSHAGPRRRYTVTGSRPDGTAFTSRQIYSTGPRIPHVEESVALVECSESPSAPGS